MGVFDFVKSVGESLFGGGGETAPLKKAAIQPGPAVKASAAAAPVQTPGPAVKPAAAHAAAASVAPSAAAIKEHVVNLGLDMKDFEVRVEGDRVILAGQAASDEIREKVILAAGNTLGVAQVEEAIQTPEAGPASVFYTVEKGDTLSKIAKAHYGDATAYPAIFAANTPMLKHPDKIYPGQVLRIPPREAKSAA
jgi:nucleoid-associated protein YgaU